MTTFARWLKRRRKELGFTQESLAEAIGYSVASVRKLEGGNRNPSLELAELLSVPLQVPAVERAEFARRAHAGLAPDSPQVEQTTAPSSGALQTPKTNLSLPVPLTPLIGRESEVEKLCAALQSEDVRLLTLAGPPGIGKTRLALEVASRFVETVEGVSPFFVDLAPLTDPTLVPVAIADALGINETGQRPLMQIIADQLQDMRALMLLDNFEQVVEAAPLVAELLWSSPSLVAIVTSREVLRVRGEWVFEVPPLEVPGPSEKLSPGELLASSALRLFVERAEASTPGFALAPDEIGVAASICARLEGLPLAIEIVAARTRLFTVQEIERRLESRVLGLGGDLRDAPPRQRSLRAAIEWSYNLLDEHERTLFARLGVFAGGFTLSAADAVCNATGDLSAVSEAEDERGVLYYLDSLAGKSMLRRERHPGEMRFTILETIREFALERLREGYDGEKSEIDELRALHTEYYLALAELAEPELSGEERKPWLDRLEREHNNLRAALVWASTQPEPEPLARLAVSLGQFWLVHRHLDEGKRWLGEVLSRDAAPEEDRTRTLLPGLLRARALLQAGNLAAIQNDYESAHALYSECIGLLRNSSCDNRGLLALALHRFSALRSERGDLHHAIEPALESLALYTEVGDRKGQADTINMLGTLHYYGGHREHGLALYEQSLALYRELGDRGGISNILNNLGEVARLEGDYARAASLYEQSLVPCRELGDPFSVGISLLNLGFVALRMSDRRRAGECFSGCLEVFSSAGSRRGVALGLVGIAGCAILDGNGERAARLLGAADSILASIGTRLAEADQEEYARNIRAAQALLTESRWNDAWDEGRNMRIENALRLALA